MSYACIGISTADGQVLTTHYQSGGNENGYYSSTGKRVKRDDRRWYDGL